MEIPVCDFDLMRAEYSQVLTNSGEVKLQDSLNIHTTRGTVFPSVKQEPLDHRTEPNISCISEHVSPDAFAAPTIESSLVTEENIKQEYLDADSWKSPEMSPTECTPTICIKEETAVRGFELESCERKLMLGGYTSEPCNGKSTVAHWNSQETLNLVVKVERLSSDMIKQHYKDATVMKSELTESLNGFDGKIQRDLQMADCAAREELSPHPEKDELRSAQACFNSLSVETSRSESEKTVTEEQIARRASGRGHLKRRSRPQFLRETSDEEETEDCDEDGLDSDGYVPDDTDDGDDGDPCRPRKRKKAALSRTGMQPKRARLDEPSAESGKSTLPPESNEECDPGVTDVLEHSSTNMVASEPITGTATSALSRGKQSDTAFRCEQKKRYKVPWDESSEHMMKGSKYLSTLTSEEYKELKSRPPNCSKETGEPVFRVRCDMCSWAFRDLDSLLKHMSKSHGTTVEKPFKCEICDTIVADQIHFTDHELEGLRFVCHICGISHVNSESRARHAIWVHNGGYGCETCGERFRHLKSLKQHLFDSEKHVPENKCPHCSWILKWANYFKHVDFHIRGFPYTCDICGYGAENRNTMVSHKLIHTGKKDQKCPHCDKCFLSVDRVKCHVRKSHTKKTYICHVCGKTFTAEGKLRNHMFRHGEKKFECETCGRKFGSRANLLNHIKFHHKPHPFQCDICGKKAVSQACLRDHMKVHSNDLPFECPVCGKKFKRKHNMQSHLRTHGEDRKFKCDICGDCFKWKHNLQNHMKTHPEETGH